MMSKPVAVFSKDVRISLWAYANLHFMLAHTTLVIIGVICVCRHWGNLHCYKKIIAVFSFGHKLLIDMWLLLCKSKAPAGKNTS